MGFSAIVKGNHSHMVSNDTPLHADAVTDTSKLLWHKYPKGQKSKYGHPYNPPASLSPALENMKVVTELMAGLAISHTSLRSLEERNAINMATNTVMIMHEASNDCNC